MQLPVPGSTPHRIEGKVLVAWVAWESARDRLAGGEGSAQLGQRYIQEMLRRSVGGGKRSSMASMVRPDLETGASWLQLHRPWNGPTANSYRLGDKASADEEVWTALGFELFGNEGLFRGVLRKPCVKYGHLGQSGAVIFGLLRRLGSCTRLQVRSAANGLVSPSTATRRLQWLVDHGIAVSSDGTTYRLADRPLEALRDYELSVPGLVASVLEQDRLHSAESLRHQIYFLGTPELQAIMRDIRLMSCIYCDADPIFGDGEVDHYPPIHWGGSNEYSLLFPSCGYHNRRLGHAVQKTPALTFSPSTDATLIRIGGGEDPVWWLEVMLDAHHRMVADAEHGDLGDARLTVERLFPVWAALRGAGGGARSVDAEGVIRDALLSDYEQSSEEALNRHRSLARVQW